MGTQGCNAACLQERHPFEAASSALPFGFWTIVTRSDGARQWVYKGYALYTYVGDTGPGDLLGDFKDDIMIQDHAPDAGPLVEGPTRQLIVWKHVEP